MVMEPVWQFCVMALKAVTCHTHACIKSAADMMVIVRIMVRMVVHGCKGQPLAWAMMSPIHCIIGSDKK